jgi:hypothetical protein
MAVDPPVVIGGCDAAFTGVPQVVQNFAFGASSASQVVQRTRILPQELRIENEELRNE